PHAGRQNCIRMGRLLVFQKMWMALREYCLILRLTGDRAFRRRTGELIVNDNRVRVVNDAQTVLPQARAVVCFFVVGRSEYFREAAKLIPCGSSREQESSRAVIDIASKHVHRRKRIVAAAVPQTGSVAPDDASCLL